MGGPPCPRLLSATLPLCRPRPASPTPWHCLRVQPSPRGLATGNRRLFQGHPPEAVPPGPAAGKTRSGQRIAAHPPDPETRCSPSLPAWALQEPPAASCGKATRHVGPECWGECSSTTLGLQWCARSRKAPPSSGRHSRLRTGLSHRHSHGQSCPHPLIRPVPCGSDREAPVKV